MLVSSSSSESKTPSPLSLDPATSEAGIDKVTSLGSRHFSALPYVCELALVRGYAIARGPFFRTGNVHRANQFLSVARTYMTKLAILSEAPSKQ